MAEGQRLGMGSKLRTSLCGVLHQHCRLPPLRRFHAHQTATSGLPFMGHLAFPRSPVVPAQSRCEHAWKQPRCQDAEPAVGLERIRCKGVTVHRELRTAGTPPTGARRDPLAPDRCGRIAPHRRSQGIGHGRRQ